MTRIFISPYKATGTEITQYRRRFGGENKCSVWLTTDQHGHLRGDHVGNNVYAMRMYGRQTIESFVYLNGTIAYEETQYTLLSYNEGMFSTDPIVEEWFDFASRPLVEITKLGIRPAIRCHRRDDRFSMQIGFTSEEDEFLWRINR